MFYAFLFKLFHSPAFCSPFLPSFFPFPFLSLLSSFNSNTTNIITIPIVTLRCVGGEAAGASSLAPKVGPLGLAAKKIADDIAAQTKAYKGLRCTIKLTVKNRQATIEVVPSASLLVIKGLKEPERDRKKEKNILHNGNLTLDAVIKMAQAHRGRSRSATLAGTVKEILGTAHSVGATVDGKSPKDIQQAITDGTIKVE
jgi:large subunit ribosomal protein L12e